VIAWALIVAMAFNAIIAWRYFFAGPTAFSVVIVALLVAGTLRKANRTAVVPAQGLTGS
jgi:hypothetical protein